LFVGRPGTTSADLQVSIALQYFPLGSVGLEPIRQYANGDACLAVDAARSIGDILAAAETDAAQRLVQFGCVCAVQFGEYLALGFAGQIGAGGRVCDKEARKADWCAHGKPTSPYVVGCEGL
jgi:hypothetical protein